MTIFLQIVFLCLHSHPAKKREEEIDMRKQKGLSENEVFRQSRQGCNIIAMICRFEKTNITHLAASYIRLHRFCLSLFSNGCLVHRIISNQPYNLSDFPSASLSSMRRSAHYASFLRLAYEKSSCVIWLGTYFSVY